MDNAQSLVTLREVTKVFDVSKQQSVVALNSVCLTVDGGEFVIITGRSGSGKTTLLNLIAGLTQPTTGEVLLDKVALWRLPDKQQSQIRNQKIGFVFQFPSLLPSLTVLENVMLPTVAGHVSHNGHAPQPAQEKAVRLLQEVGLADKLRAYPRQLSAGQQQRVVVARSLINDPQILLADEPTSNLDEQTEYEIMEVLRSIHRERPITIMLVTHTTELSSFGTRSLRMADGQVVG